MTILQPLAVPAGYTIMQAIDAGLLPMNAQVSSYKGVSMANQLNPTLAFCISNGLVDPKDLFSNLTMTSGPQYGGN